MLSEKVELRDLRKLTGTGIFGGSPSIPQEITQELNLAIQAIIISLNWTKFVFRKNMSFGWIPTKINDFVGIKMMMIMNGAGLPRGPKLRNGT